MYVFVCENERESDVLCSNVDVLCLDNTRLLLTLGQHFAACRHARRTWLEQALIKRGVEQGARGRPLRGRAGSVRHPLRAKIHGEVEDNQSVSDISRRQLHLVLNVLRHHEGRGGETWVPQRWGHGWLTFDEHVTCCDITQC